MSLFIIAVSLALVVSFVCSICEAVLLSINHAQIEAVSNRHASSGRLLSGFKRHIDAPVAAILILNTAAHTVGATVSGATYVEVFSERSLWLFSLTFTLAVLLFTEIVPKTLGVSYTRQLAVPVAHTIRWLTFLLRPAVRVSERISRSLRREHSSPVTSVEEIRLLASLGRSEGIVGEGTADMIVGATLLRKMRVVEVMVPRQRVVFLSARDSREQVLRTLKDSEFSRFPFTPTGDIDDTAGVVLSRDLLFWIHEHPGDEIDWPNVSGDALIVPESTSVEALLKTFQAERRHLAVVVDEFGGVEGIATLEDVIEEVVGEIEDESDEPTALFIRQPDGSIDFRARTDLRRVYTVLGLAWAPEGEATTFGGLLTERLGRIPANGDLLHWRGYRLEVIAANPRKAEVIRATWQGSEADDPAADP